MKKKKDFVRAFDFGTGETYKFSTHYRYAAGPKHMFAPPNFTTDDAFDEFGYLEDAPSGEIVFIEWPDDRFSVFDSVENEYVPGPVVWRKAKVL